MRKQILLLTSLLLVAVVLLTVTRNTAANGAQIYETPMKVHASQDPATPLVPSSNAKLVTNKNGATMTVNTSLTPGHAVTLWLIVANNPGACATSPCTAADILFNTAAVEAQVTYGAGHIVDADGQVSLAAHLRKGSVPDGWYEGQGFTDPTTAEVHLVINDHGPKLANFMPDMIQTYRGGCTDESLPPPFPDSAKADGTPGPNTCRLVQFAIFQQD